MSTQSISWPVVEHSKLFHVGQFNPALKGATHNAMSLEGNGLSVSLQPEAWRHIAKLGDDPTWCLKTAAASNFLDVHALTATHWKQAIDWAVAEGLLRPTKVMVVSWYDEDRGVTSYMEFDANDAMSSAAAESEFQACEQPDPKLETKDGFAATDKLVARMGFEIDVSLARHLALTVYIEDVLFEQAGLHGAWWEDETNELELSAPRGVIHDKALSLWNKELTARAMPERRSSARPR